MRRFILLSCSVGSLVSLAQTPSIDRIVNAANYTAAPAAPGSLITIFGSNLAPSASAAPAPLPTSLNTVSVRAGTVLLPLQFVSATQINAQVPWELAANARFPVTVQVDTASSAPQDLVIAPVAPAIFAVESAAARGVKTVSRGEYLRIYCTGLGDVSNRPGSGANADDTNLAAATASFTVSIGGVSATPAFAGMAPAQLLGIDTVGLYQIDVQVPVTAALSDSAAITVSGGGVTSNAASVAIRAEDPRQVIAQWTQLGPDGAIARAVTSQSTCPDIGLDGANKPMLTRARPSLPLYPVTSCEIALPAATRSAAIAGASLPLPNPNLTRITLIGDTGCRIEVGRYQACNDPVQWPTWTVAASAAATAPGLIVQLGDYHYRAAPCLAGSGCDGSPWGFNWPVWNADFVAPMAPVFAAAPMVMIRGNHESCALAGEGWFRFLDPRPYPAACRRFNDPYTVQAGPTQLFVIDSNEATDTTADPALVGQFIPYFQQLSKVVTPNTWVVMHHPMWGFDSTGTRNLSLQTASQNQLPDGVQLVLGGHIHTFQTLTFPARAPQMIAGNSGDQLQAYAASVTGFAGMTVGGASVTEGDLYKDFGFTTMDWTGSAWTAVARDVNGAPVMTCTVTGNALPCTK